MYRFKETTTKKEFLKNIDFVSGLFSLPQHRPVVPRPQPAQHVVHISPNLLTLLVARRILLAGSGKLFDPKELDFREKIMLNEGGKFNRI